MFYKDEKSPCLLLGDVLKGFLTVCAIINKPITDINNSSNHKYQVDIKSDFHVIMTPCCSIEGSKLYLVPLELMRRQFRRNRYISKDFTIINRKMPHAYVYPNNEWDTLSLEERKKILAEDDDYQFLEFFVYRENEYFPECRMIDFRKMFSIQCEQIKRNIRPDSDVVKAKILELNESIRIELAKKLEHFFSRG